MRHTLLFVGFDPLLQLLLGHALDDLLSLGAVILALCTRHATQQVSAHVRASGRVELIKALYLRCIVIVFFIVFIVPITFLVVYVAFGILRNFLLLLDPLSLLVLFVVLRHFLLLLFLFFIVLLLLFLFALGLLVLFFFVLAYERQLDLRLRSGSHNDGQRLWLGHCEWWHSDCVSTTLKI